MTSQWSTFKSWASSEGLDYTDITVQMRYVEESEFANASVYNAYVSSPTYEEVKITTDITTAVEAFMAAYERCTGGSYEVTKITLKGSNRKYQDGEKRIQFANNLAENMGNIAIDSDGSSSDGSDGATENADGSTTTSSGMVVINNVYYTEEELSAYRKLGEMNIDEQYLSDATRNNLGVEDLDAVTNWQNNVNSIQKESGIVSVIRKITQLLGILLTIYVIFIYIAYWFDRLNNFLDIDLLKILTFGKFMISEDEDSCTYKTKDFGDGKTKTVNHRAILTICVIGLVFATLIMTGTLYTLIMKLVMFIRHKIGG
jgi:hypothetical protein